MTVKIEHDGEFLRLERGAAYIFVPCKSSLNGRFVLGWNNVAAPDDSLLTGGKTSGLGECFLVEKSNAGLALKNVFRCKRPEGGAVTDNGVCLLHDWHHGQSPEGTLLIYAPNGEKLLTHHFKANLGASNSSISPDGRFALCATYHSESEEADRIHFFDIEAQRKLWMKEPETGLHFCDSRIAPNAKHITLIYRDEGFAVYDFTGEIVDYKGFRGSLTNHSLYKLFDEVADFCEQKKRGFQEGETREAEMLFARLKAAYSKCFSTSECADVWCIIGDLMDSINFPDKALEAYHKALALGAGDESHIWRSIGEMHDARNNWPDAIAAYEKALMLNEKVGVKGKLKAAQTKNKKAAL